MGPSGVLGGLCDLGKVKLPNRISQIMVLLDSGWSKERQRVFLSCAEWHNDLGWAWEELSFAGTSPPPKKLELGRE